MAQLLSNLPIGAKVKFGKYAVGSGEAQPIIWMVVAKNHVSTPAYPSNSVTLLTEKVIEALAMDAREPSSRDEDRRYYGNSNYPLSNLDQWLNKDSSAGNWYSPTHSEDQAPTNEYVSRTRGYVDKPAFLNLFTTYEKNAILDTTIRYSMGNPPKEYVDISRKVFLPSNDEVGTSTYTLAEGSVWEYFNIPYKDNASHWICPITQQLSDDPTLDVRPYAETGGYNWWLRSEFGTSMYVVNPLGNEIGQTPFQYCGVRPAINLSYSAKISDTVDSDGCHTFVWNSAPYEPAMFNTPATIYGGKSNPISWTKAIDVDDDLLTYQLECSVDGGDYTTIYSGVALSYAHLVPFGTTTISYRVKSIDPYDLSSGYVTSDTLTVVNNNAPVISGTDSNLGVKSEGFAGECTITDANKDAVTVTIAIDGVRIRSLVATLGEPFTYGVTENTWLALPNGSHTLTISATDGIDTSVRTYTFAKLVDTLKIQNATPWAASTMPSRIMLVVTRNIPSSATFKVEVCNNGYDVSPTWEDATDAVLSGLVHVFSNKSKTASNWGVLVRVTVERNGATGACYVSAIGGNFE